MRRKSNSEIRTEKARNKEKNIRCRAFAAHAYEKDNTESMEKAKRAFFRPAYAGTAMVTKEK